MNSISLYRQKWDFLFITFQEKSFSLTKKQNPFPGSCFLRFHLIFNFNDFFLIVASACFTNSVRHHQAPHLLHFTRFGALIFQFARLLSRLALDVLFFGHMDIGYTSLNLLNISLIAAMRGSFGSSAHPQGPSLRFFPHWLQMPLQSSLQRTFKGQLISTSR